MSEFLMKSIFWKYCLNSDEISKFSEFVTDTFWSNRLNVLYELGL